MKYTISQVLEMARAYRRINPDMTINTAVNKAYEAYDIFRDAEFEIQIRSNGQ